MTPDATPTEALLTPPPPGDGAPAIPDTAGTGPGAGRPAPTPGAESISRPPATRPGPALVAAGRRRGPADPVRAVMRRHQAMVAGAVDVWEVAAGLEAYGISDGEVRRLRHRDVFGLAEELHARVPRAVRAAATWGVVDHQPPDQRLTGADPGAQHAEHTLLGAGRHHACGRPTRERLGGRALASYLLPGAGCVLAAGLPAVAAPVAVLVAAATWAALRGGPLRAASVGRADPWTYGLLGFALYGPQAVAVLAGRGRFDTGAGTAAFAALALSLAPAAALAGWFAAAARAQLAPSHSLADFAAAVRPRLAAALAGYAAALTALLLLATAMAGPAPLAGPAALGMLLFTARLLAVHDHPATAVAGLAGTCAAEALALVLAAAPGHLAPDGGTAEAAACGAAALVLAARAFRLLARPAACRPPDTASFPANLPGHNTSHTDQETP